MPGPALWERLALNKPTVSPNICRQEIKEGFWVGRNRTVMLRKFLWLTLCLLAASPLPVGCSKPDRHTVNYSQVQTGVSTKVDVMAIYGKPKFVLPARDGTEQWSYDVDASGEFIDKNHTLVFIFDQNGVLLNKSKFTSKWP
jgi:hypothetical protein